MPRESIHSCVDEIAGHVATNTAVCPMSTMQWDKVLFSVELLGPWLVLRPRTQAVLGKKINKINKFRRRKNNFRELAFDREIFPLCAGTRTTSAVQI